MSTETLEDVKVPEVKGEPTPYRVYQTTNYDTLVTMAGNRRINQPNFRRLKVSMEKRQLFSPILVNERMQIIDGQHRFLCCQELKLPVFYIVVPNYGLEEVQILNTNTANWTKMDYLKSFCDLKNYEYIKFKRFMLDYPDFGFQSAYRLLTLSTGMKIKVKKGKKKNQKFSRDENAVTHLKTFENGELVIPDLKRSEELAKKIMMFKPFYKGFNRRTFVASMIGIFANPNYSQNDMLKKLEQQPTALVDCINISQYKSLVEDIYNYKRREKINLRFV